MDMREVVCEKQGGIEGKGYDEKSVHLTMTMPK